MVGLIQTGRLKDQDPSALESLTSQMGSMDKEPMAQDAQDPMAQDPMAQEQQDPMAQGGQTDDKMASVDEQESYEKLVVAGMKLLYDDKTHKKVVDMLRQGADTPPKTLSNVSMMVFSEIDKASGGTVPEMVIAQGVDALLEEVATIAQESGAFPVDEQVATQAREEMMLALGEQFGADDTDVQELMGSYSQEEIQQMKSQHEAAAGIDPSEEMLPEQAQPQEPQVM
jgi:hypothetical protein